MRKNVVLFIRIYNFLGTYDLSKWKPLSNRRWRWFRISRWHIKVKELEHYLRIKRVMVMERDINPTLHFRIYLISKQKLAQSTIFKRLVKILTMNLMNKEISKFESFISYLVSKMQPSFINKSKRMELKKLRSSRI